MKRSACSPISKALFLTLLFAGCPAFSDSHLIVNFSNGYNGAMPKRLALIKRKQLRGYQPRACGAYQTLHIPIETNPAMLSFNAGRYHIQHLDFTNKKRGDDKTTYFPKQDLMRFEPDTIYYLGDITFTESDLIAKSAIDAIQPLCAQHAQLQAATEIFYVFNRSEPIKIEQPCKQAEQ